MNFSWKKERRVRKSTEFRFIQKNGKKWRKKDLLFLYVPSSVNQSRVGFVVSRKVGNAVVRNKVKRRLREATRCNYSFLKQGIDVVIIAFPSSSTTSLDILDIQIRDSFVAISKRMQ